MSNNQSTFEIDCYMYFKRKRKISFSLSFHLLPKEVKENIKEHLILFILVMVIVMSSSSSTSLSWFLGAVLSLPLYLGHPNTHALFSWFLLLMWFTSGKNSLEGGLGHWDYYCHFPPPVELDSWAWWLSNSLSFNTKIREKMLASIGILYISCLIRPDFGPLASDFAVFLRSSIILSPSSHWLEQVFVSQIMLRDFLDSIFSSLSVSVSFVVSRSFSFIVLLMQPQCFYRGIRRKNNTRLDSWVSQWMNGIHSHTRQD